MYCQSKHMALISARVDTYVSQWLEKNGFPADSWKEKSNQKALLQTFGPKKDKNAPKRPMSAWTIFTKEKRASVSEANPDLGFGLVSKKLSEMWNGLSKSERAKYDKKHEQDAERYEKEMESYTPPDMPDGSVKVSHKRTGPTKKSGYLVFCEEQRPGVRDTNPEMKMPDVSKELGARWRVLSEDEKAKYKSKADAINAEAGLSKEKATDDKKEKTKDDKKEKKGKKSKEEKPVDNEELEEEPEKPEKPKKTSKKSADGAKKPFTVYCDKHRSAMKKKHPKASKEEITNLLEEAFKGLSKTELKKYKA